VIIEEEFGFPAVTGYVKMKKEGVTEYHGHNWNINPETGNYIDINIGQFYRDLPGIFTIPMDSEEAERIYEVFRPA